MNDGTQTIAELALLAQQSEGVVLVYSLWIGFGLLMLLATILIWTRWGHAKPIWKCVALSIFAHVLLGGYAYGTKLFFAYQAPQAQDEPVSFSVLEETEMDPEEDDSQELDVDSEQPWEKFADNGVGAPQALPQTKLESHQATLPKRQEKQQLPQFQQHEIHKPTSKAIVQQTAPDLKDNEDFRIQQEAVSQVEPAQVAENSKPVLRNTAFQVPQPTAPQTNIEKKSATVQNKVPEPEMVPGAVNPDRLTDELQKQMVVKDAQFVPGPDHLPNDLPQGAANDHPSTHNPTAKPPWRNAAFSNRDQQQDKTPRVAQPRRLADGQPIPKMYQNRFAENRSTIVQQAGGSRETEQAVKDALQWLASTQDADGKWNPRKFNAGNEANVYGHNRGGAGFNADTGITGLVILSFLGGGHTHLEGPYQKTIQKGLEYLIRTQNQDGSLYGNAGLFARTYCHGMAMMAISEAYSITGDNRIKPFILKAQQFTVDTQNKRTGGWRYRPGDDGDMSQFGWQVMALKSAEQAGIPIPASTRKLMIQFLDSYKKGRSNGLASYRPAEGPTRTMTAEALFCRRLLDAPVSAAMSNEAVSFVLEELPSQSKVKNLYYWYYATLALHREKDVSDFQAANWKKWNQSLTRKLLSLQVKEGERKGSFSQDTLWSPYGGTCYSTAMSTLCLEVYYRYQTSDSRQHRTASNR